MILDNTLLSFGYRINENQYLVIIAIFCTYIISERVKIYFVAFTKKHSILSSCGHKKERMSHIDSSPITSIRLRYLQYINLLFPKILCISSALSNMGIDEAGRLPCWTLTGHFLCVNKYFCLFGGFNRKFCKDT